MNSWIWKVIAMSNGIDCSKWQGAIDWNTVKNSDVKFAIIREGYGKESPSQVDKQFENNYSGAKSASIPVGVYHYSYADSTNDAKLEAQFCLKNIQGKQLEYPVIFDIEDSEMLALTNQQRTDLVKSFCSTIEDAGYYAMYYCNLNWYNNCLIPSQLADYDLWLAQWYAQSPTISCGIWQYSEKGSINGISGNVDMNVSYKDYPMIMKLKGINGYSSISAADYPSNTTNYSSNQKQTYINYVVVQGDTLSSIAAKYGTTSSKIAEINNIKEPNRIYVNQLVKVPVASSVITYTVISGDTLSSIAAKYNTTVDSIVKLNNLKDKNLIYPGQTLTI